MLPPSTSRKESRFHPRAYWRGPVWPIISWLIWRSLKEVSEEEQSASSLRAALE